MACLPEIYFTAVFLAENLKNAVIYHEYMREFRKEILKKIDGVLVKEWTDPVLMARLLLPCKKSLDFGVGSESPLLNDNTGIHFWRDLVERFFETDSMCEYMNNAEYEIYRRTLLEDDLSSGSDDEFISTEAPQRPSKFRRTGMSSSTAVVKPTTKDVWIAKFNSYRRHVKKVGTELDFSNLEDYTTKSMKFIFQYRHIDKEFAFVALRLIGGMPTSQLSESVYSYCTHQLFVNQSAETLSARVKVNGNKPYFKCLDK